MGPGPRWSHKAHIWSRMVQFMEACHWLSGSNSGQEMGVEVGCGGRERESQRGQVTCQGEFTVGSGL